MLWDLKTAADYERAAERCEVPVTMEELHADDNHTFLREMLAHDMRKEGFRGMVLQDNYEMCGLRKNDRLECSATLPEVVSFLGEDPPAIGVVFWRRSRESMTLRRNPLFDASVGTDLQAMVSIDVMHSWCLGIFQQMVGHCLWELVESMGQPGQHLAEARHTAMEELRVRYQGWLRDVRTRRPELVVSALGDLTLDVLGPRDAPMLKRKAHECLTLLRWLAELVPHFSAQMPNGNHWRTGVQSLVRMWELLDNAPMNVPAAVKEELVGTPHRLWKLKSFTRPAGMSRKNQGQSPKQKSRRSAL